MGSERKSLNEKVRAAKNISKGLTKSNLKGGQKIRKSK